MNIYPSEADEPTQSKQIGFLTSETTVHEQIAFPFHLSCQQDNLHTPDTRETLLTNLRISWNFLFFPSPCSKNVETQSNHQGNVKLKKNEQIKINKVIFVSGDKFLPFPYFKSRRDGYKPVFYGLNNTRPTYSERAHWKTSFLPASW